MIYIACFFRVDVAFYHPIFMAMGLEETLTHQLTIKTISNKMLREYVSQFNIEFLQIEVYMDEASLTINLARLREQVSLIIK